MTQSNNYMCLTSQSNALRQFYAQRMVVLLLACCIVQRAVCRIQNVQHKSLHSQIFITQ